MIVCAATNNAGKLKELRRILTRCGHEVKSLRELGVTLDPEETGTTFAENAKIKAEAFCKATGLPTVADDSGLCVDALNGAPGVYSARYAGEHGNDAANNEKLMAEMQNVPVGQRAAKFVSAVCLILPDGRELVVTGECPGSVALTPAGDNGFGYDPLFVPDAVGLPGGGPVVLVVADQRLFDVEMVQQLHGHTGVLGGNKVCRAKGGRYARRHIVQIADGRCHDIKSSCHSLPPI